MDVIGTFLEECCVLVRTAKAKASELFAAYRIYTEQAGERSHLTQKAFGQALAERGFESGRSGSAHWWRGVGLLGELGDAS
jgi:putative DNA primase/helicase